ncbi:MAG: response regulator [Bacteriovoracaceae bacterium]|nr:response regulator [Bacteriovoracaceae bacterium]
MNEAKFLNDLVTNEKRLFGEKRVVVLDDCKNSLMLIQRYLDQFDNIHLEVFQDEFEAIRSIIREKPELLVMDINMPKLDGIRVFTLLEEMSISNVPVIFISGDKSVESMVSHLKQNTSFIKKPLKKNTLIEQVNRVLKSA